MISNSDKSGGIYNAVPSNGGISYNSKRFYNSRILNSVEQEPDNPKEPDFEDENNKRKEDVNMAEFYCYEGLRNGGTFKVDDTTASAHETESIVGKVVTLTDNYTVGFGSAGDNPLGFVEQVESESTNSEELVVSVVWNQSREDIACAGSETAGSWLAVDGKGGVQTSSSATSAKVWGVDAETKTCATYISG